MTSAPQPNSYSSTLPQDAGTPDPGAAAILRGVQRLLRAQNYESIAEMSLGNGRRADVFAIGPLGDIWIIEIKSCIADFRADHKWPEYRDYCDYLSFAVAPDFPLSALPEDTGMVLADAYGGEIARPAPRHPLGAARRKTLLIEGARAAAMRLHARIDPGQIFG